MANGSAHTPSQNRDASPGYSLITGASSGIGESFARALASRGRSLVLVARSHEKMERLKAELSSRHSVQVETIPQDLAAPGAAARVVAELAKRGLVVDLLVNNAGFVARGEFWKLPFERQSEMLRLNIGALTELTYLLLPCMLSRGAGGIIYVSSTTSFLPIPYLAEYAATKAYVTSFAIALAEEVRKHGVKILALCPGATDTDFFLAGQFGKMKFEGGLQSPDEVAEIGLKALEGGQSIAVPRLFNKLVVFAQRFVSRGFAARLAGRKFKPESLKRTK